MTHANVPQPDDLRSQVPGGRILVVSHRVADAEAIRGLLLTTPFACEIEAPAPRNPASAVEAHRPDLILLDMTARGPEALSLLKTLRAAVNSDPPILAAGDRTGEWRAQALACGADDVIVKPLVPEELTARAHNLLLSRLQQRWQQERSRTSAPVQACPPGPEEGDFTVAMVNRMGQAVVACDDSGDLYFCNDAAIQLGLNAPQTGRPAALPSGRLRSVGGGELTADEDPLRRAWAGENVAEQQVWLATSDRGLRTFVANAAPILGDRARRLGAVVTLHDVTDLHRVTEELRRGLMHDELTGLPNTALFFELAKRAIAANAREHQSLALIVITLTDVYEVTEHQASTGPPPIHLTLTALAHKLPRLLRPGDIAGRYGEGFLLLCGAPVAEATAQQIVERLRVGLGRPLEIAHRRVEPRLAFGVVTTYDARFSAEELAEIAAATARPSRRIRHVEDQALGSGLPGTGW
jgi:PleD family two-component response regulator